MYTSVNETLNTPRLSHSVRLQIVNPVNFLEGITGDPASFHVYLPFSTVGDFENYIQRLTLLPKQVSLPEMTWAAMCIIRIVFSTSSIFPLPCI